VARWNTGAKWNTGEVWEPVAGRRGPRVVVQADHNRDGVYDDALSHLEGAIRVTTRAGMENPFDSLAPMSECVVELDNSAGDYDFENGAATYAGLLARGVPVRVRAYWAGAAYTLYEGKLRERTQTVGVYGEKIARLLVTDQWPELAKATLKTPLLRDVRADEVMAAIFATAPVAWPGDGRYWVLDYSTLGTDTRPWDNPATALEPGSTEYAYVGDNVDRGDDATAGGLIQWALAGEIYGRFFYNARNHLWTFWNRVHDAYSRTSLATVTAAEIDAYSYVEHAHINVVEVQFEPREVGTPGSVLWQMTDLPLVIPARQTVQITAHFTDPDHPATRVGAFDVIQPVRDVDYAAESVDGEYRSNYLFVYATVFSDRAELTLTSTRGNRLFVTLSRIRGTPIVRYQAASVHAERGASIGAYDRSTRLYQVLALSDEETAQQAADDMAGRWMTPVRAARDITITPTSDETALMTTSLARQIGDRVTVQDAGQSHNRDYVVVGEQHVLELGQDTRHTALWTLEPIDTAPYWLLGTSTLGTDTRLAF
jgi:hypothetical protein